jgi:hypothetical protein
LILLTFVIDEKVTGENNMLLDNYQIIKESGIERFAVIDFSDFKEIKELFNSTEKLQDFLDYLHIQEVKSKQEKKFSLEDVKKEIGL